MMRNRQLADADSPTHASVTNTELGGLTDA